MTTSIDREIRMAACMAFCQQTRAWARHMRVGPQAVDNLAVSEAWVALIGCEGRLTVAVRKILEQPVKDASAQYESVAACVEAWLRPNHLMRNPHAVLGWFQSMAREVFWKWARDELDWALRTQREKGEETFREAMWRVWPIIAFGGANLDGCRTVFVVQDPIVEFVYREDMTMTNPSAGKIDDAIKSVPEQMPARLTKAEWDALGDDGQYVYQERMGIGDELGMFSEESHRFAITEARMESDRTPANTRMLIAAAQEAFGGELLSVRPRKHKGV